MKQLANGRIITESVMDNGATLAEMEDGGDMNEREWLEYVRLILAKNSAPARTPAKQDLGVTGCGNTVFANHDGTLSTY